MKGAKTDNDLGLGALVLDPSQKCREQPEDAKEPKCDDERANRTRKNGPCFTLEPASTIHILSDLKHDLPCWDSPL